MAYCFPKEHNRNWDLFHTKKGADKKPGSINTPQQANFLATPVYYVIKKCFHSVLCETIYTEVVSVFSTPLPIVLAICFGSDLEFQHLLCTSAKCIF